MTTVADTVALVSAIGTLVTVVIAAAGFIINGRKVKDESAKTRDKLAITENFTVEQTNILKAMNGKLDYSLRNQDDMRKRLTKIEETAKAHRISIEKETAQLWEAINALEDRVNNG